MAYLALLSVPEVASSARPYLVAAFLVTALLVGLCRATAARIHPDEPPLVKPRIPFVGHVLGIISEQSQYFVTLYQRHKLPIMTLPLLGKKMYVATDPQLIQAAFRSRALSFDVFNDIVIEKLLDVDQATQKAMQDKTQSPTVIEASARAIFIGLSGENLARINIRVLEGIAVRLNAVPPQGLHIPNFWIWLRDTVTAATVAAMFGETQNPFAKNPALLQDIWTFDSGVPGIMSSPLPGWVTHGKALAARNRVQDGLVEYYEGKYDTLPETSDFIRGHTETLRRAGITDPNIARIGVFLLSTAIQNAVPTLLWLMLSITGRREWVHRIGAEVEPLLVQGISADGIREARLDVSSLEEKTPFLHACYQEAIRIANAVPGIRRVEEDTYLMDGRKQRYLLKKGTDIIMAAGVSHRLEDVWEENPDVFNPANFLELEDEREEGEKGIGRLDKGAGDGESKIRFHLDDAEEKRAQRRRRKAAFVPFGGGKHYCPGRKISSSESLALAAALATGFDLEIRGRERLRMGAVRFGEATSKPLGDAEGLEATLRKRQGWEDTRWRFVCS